MDINGDNEYSAGSSFSHSLRSLVRRKAFYIPVSAIVVVVAIALIALPFIIRSKLVTTLEAAGMTGVVVTDVDLNPVTRRFAVKGFAFTSPDGFTVKGSLVEVRVRVLPIVKRHISLRGITLDSINVELDSARLKERERPDKAESASPALKKKGRWAAGVDAISITDSSVGYRTGSGVAVVDVDDISLTGYKGWDASHAVTLGIRLGFDTGTLVMKASGTPMAAEPGMRMTVEVAELPLAWAMPIIDDAGVRLDGTLTAELALDANTKPGAGTMDISHRGTVALDGLEAEHTGRRLTVGRAAVEASINAIHPLPAGQGRPAISTATASLTLGKGEGRTGVSMVSLVDDLEVLGADDITVSGITMDASRRAEVKSVRATGLSLGRPTGADDRRAALVALKRLVVNGFELVPGELVHIGAIELDEPRLAVERDSTGRTALIDSTVSAAGGGKQPEAAEAAKKQPAAVEAKPAPEPSKAARVVVDRIEMKGSGSVDFTDSSVRPVFKTRLDLEKLVVKGVDTAPTAAEPKGAELTLRAGVGAYAKLDMGGTVSVHESPPSMSLKGRITSVEMPPLSSYTHTALGYNLTSGQMDADLNAEVDNGEIDGKAALLIRGLEVEPSGDSAAEDLTSELTMPLGSALSLLRSADGSIKLDIPVTGDLSSPKFSLAAVINKAVGGAMKKAAFSYLKYYFQPYGSLITAVQVVGKYAAAVRLDPIVFEPGAVEVPAGATEYLDKVAGFMTERPGVSVRLCGFAVDDEPLADWWRLRSREMKATGVELSKEADGLALWRAQAVKARLVGDYGIEDSRLLVCLPEVEAAPVVEETPAKDGEKAADGKTAEKQAAPAPRPQPRVEVLI